MLEIIFDLQLFDEPEPPSGDGGGEITNASGDTVSNSVGTVNVTLDSDSKWYLTGDTYITDFEDDAANVISNGFTLYENGVALEGTTSSEDGGLTLENSNDNSLVSGSDYADTITNSGENVTVVASTGNDSISGVNSTTNIVATVTDSSIGGVVITNEASNTLLSGSKYSDTIDNTGDSVTVNTGAGEDLISNTGDSVTVYAGADDDSITNDGSNVALSGSTGNDTISNSGEKVSISGGAGNDIIENSGSNVTINSGAGNDSITNTGENVTIIAGAGDNTISGVNSTTNIQGNFTDSTVEGDNVILTSSNGTLTIIDGKDKTFYLNGEETVISEDPLKTIALTVAELTMKETSSGYPAIAAFSHSDALENAAPPTNYFASETWEATSADDLKLSAVHYSPETPTGKWVILVHPYSYSGSSMNPFATPYLAQGFDVLIIDQRAAGKSEGDWLTMGVAESADLAIWTQKIANTNANAQITLHGVSMGAATVMLSAALSQTVNVTSIIEDSGYGNIAEVFANVLENYADAFVEEGIDIGELFDAVDKAAESVNGGYSAADAKAIEAIGNVTVPSLFIHGTKDTLIPVSVASELYAASGAEVKDFITVEAAHAMSGLVDSETYLEHVLALIDKADSEIGASINSTEADKLLRGTIYDDTITNSGENVTIDAIAGDNQIISSKASNASIVAGAGNDSIFVFEGANAYIDAGNGDNYVFNGYVYYDDQNKLVNQDGSATTSTLIGGEGNDTLVNQGIYNSSILAGEGNNFIGIYHSYNNTIVTGSGNDSVVVSDGSSLSVYTGAGDDSIIGRLGEIEEDDWSFGDSATIDAGDGDDYISPHYSSNSSIYGGAGNDTIINNGANTTIDGGDGDDYISLTANYFETPTSVEPAVIVASAGDDTVVGLTSTTSIQGAFTSATVDGDNVILTADEGSLTVIDGKDQILNINGASSIIGSDYTKEVLTVDGVLYALENGAALTFDADGKVTGIESGTATAQIAGAETSPKITLDGSTAFNFTASAENDVLKISENGHNFNYVSGEMTYSASGVYFHPGEVGIKTSNEIFAQILGTVTVTIPESGLELPLTANETSINFNDDISATVSGGTASGSLSVTGGSIAYDSENKKITLAKDTKFVVEDLAIAEGINALNFDITALAESVLELGGSGLLSNIAIKDGSSVHIGGKTFGIEGSFTLANGDITFGLLEMLATGAVSNLTIAQGATLTMDIENVLPISITAPAENSAQITREDNVFSLTTSDDNGLDISVGDLEEIPLNVKGTIKIDNANQSITLTKDTVITANLPDGSTAKVTANDDATANIDFVENEFTISPQAGNGNLNIAVTNSDGELILDSEIEMLTGSVIYNPQTNHISVAAGTEAKFTVGDYTFTTSNSEDVGGTFEFGTGITYTPDSNSGAVSLTVENSEGTILDGVSMEFKNGSFTFENTNAISVSKDTEVLFKFSENYSVAFKATDEAGGQISLVDGGISYAPNSEDGNLELTVTKGDTTRTASLEITGSVTYTLGGEFLLAEDTVIKNVFEDGVTLSIISNSDGSGTITFAPEGGLTITPATEDSLSINLEVDGYNFVGDNINGSVNYNGGVVTFADGTEMSGTIAEIKTAELLAASDDSIREISLSTTGGATTADFSGGSLSFTPEDGATFNISMGDSSIELLSGTMSLDFEEIFVKDGSTINAYSTLDFILENSGTYTLNGQEITTTADNVKVYLANYDTVKFDGNEAVSLGDETVSGDVKVQITNGEVSFVMYETGTFNIDGKTFELIEDVAEGVTISAIENGYAISHVGTAEEAELYGDPESYIGKIFTENITINNDEDYKLQICSSGATILSGVSDGAQIDVSAEFDGAKYEYSTGFEFVTDEEGVITFGNRELTITGDSSVSLHASFNDGAATIESVDGLDVTITGNLNDLYQVNDALVSLGNGAENASIEIDSYEALISGLADGAAISVDSQYVLVNANNSLTLNDVTYNISGDSDGVLINAYDNIIATLDENASLTVSEAGTYMVNGIDLNVSEGDVIVGMNENYAYIARDEQFSSNTSTSEILDALGVTESDAVVIAADVAESQQATLNDDGELAIIENTEEPVTIIGGSGNDTIVTKGEDVTVDLSNGGEDKVIALGGNVKLENYAPATSAGIQLTVDDMKEEPKFNNGKIELANATVDPESNFINLYDINGDKNLVGFATPEEKVVDASSFIEDAVLIGGGEDLLDSISGVSLLGGEGNDFISSGEKAYIAPGKGGNIVELNGGNSTIEFGGGEDYITGFNFADSDSTDKITNATVENATVYGDNTVYLSMGDGAIMIEDAKNKDIAIGDDTLQVGEDEVKFDGVANKYLATGENASVTVAENYAGENPPVIALNEIQGNVNAVDASNYDGAAEITGNENNNTIVASEGGSTINAGAGKNSIKGGAGADEFISNSGKDTISGFGFGAGDTADIFNSEEAALIKAQAKDNDIIFSFENGSAQIENAAGQTIKFQNKFTNNTPIFAQFAKDSLTVNDEANFYYATGNSATISIGANVDTTTTLAVDLTNGDFNNAEKLSFAGDIKAVDASSFGGAAEIIGNENNNVLTASAGGSTLNGGSDNDTLIGGSGADEFVYEKGSGDDLISGFNFGTGKTADKLNTREMAINYIQASGNDIILEVDGGSVKVENGVGKTIQFQSEYTNNETIAAQFANNSVAVNDGANFYWAAGSDATVSIQNYSATSANIDLSNGDFNNASQISFAGDIKTLNATGYGGNSTLTGNASDNVIIGGNGNSTLWGGKGGNDTLIGGSGADTFIYSKNNGDDVVQGAASNDLVKLDGITLDDLKALGNDLFFGNDVKFELNDGGSLTVKDAKTSGVVIEVGGTKYAVNQSSGEWEFRN